MSLKIEREVSDSVQAVFNKTYNIFNLKAQYVTLKGVFGHELE